MDPLKPLLPLPRDPVTQQDYERAANVVVGEVMKRLRAAKHPVLWGGELLQRLGLEGLFEDLVKITGLPYTTTLLGKSLISEDNPHFIGVYDSKFAPPDTVKVVEGADCLLALGTILSDFYGDIVEKTHDRMILAAGGAVRVGPAVYPNVPLDLFMVALLRAVQAEAAAVAGKDPPPGFAASQRVRKAAAFRETAADAPQEAGRDQASLTWDSFFHRMHSFIEPHMVVMADTSMALFPAAELLIRERGHFIAQTAWLSIGYTVGAMLGVGMRDSKGERAVVFAGDGGFQMIPQAFSTLVRHGKPAIVFVFDNQLYGIEQFLVDGSYYGDPNKRPVFFNVLPEWDYVQLAQAFGGKGYAVRTLTDLDMVLKDVVGLTDTPALIAVRLDPKDLPRELGVKPGTTAAFQTDADAARGPTFAARGFD